MQNSLITTLLITFTKAESRDFAYFLRRPERRTRKDVVLLGELLLERPNISTEAAFIEVIGARAFKPQAINQLASWLYTEAKAFLLERHHAISDEIPLLHEFDRRGLNHHRERLRKQLRKQRHNATTTYELETAIYATAKRGSRTEPNNLQAVNDSLDADFLHKKLRQACLMQSHENVFAIEYDNGLLAVTLAHVETLRLYKQPVIGVYYHIYQCLRFPDRIDHFGLFQKLLPQLPETLNEEERRDLYLLGINFCIRRANQDDQLMVREALRLYREGLNNGSLLENGRLTSYSYRNAVALALKIKDFAWASDFTEQYASALPPDQREELRAYNRARLAFAIGDPDKALKELRFVRSKDVLFTLTMDTLRAKVYFETDAYDLLTAHLDKMYIYLRRKGDSYHHKNYANFIALLKRILHLRPRPDEHAKLRKTIEEESVLTERRWLLQRLEGQVRR
jgi:hypothetical protein